MSIQEFALQLKQEAELSPLFQALQALRKCRLDQLRSEDMPQWKEWPPVGATDRGQTPCGQPE